MFKEKMAEAARAYHIDLNAAQLEQFSRYNDLLLEWNQKMNLTAITEPQEVAVKHMVDSLSCYRADCFETGAYIADVGTGAGFPGIPLKILRGDLHLTLLDSLSKRVNFLRCVARALALDDVEIVHTRAEDAGRKAAYRDQFDVVVSRAVARLNVLCELCLPFVRPGGYFIALKGSKYQEETDEAKTALFLLGGVIEEIVPVKLPGIDDVRAVLYIKKKGKTPRTYPRKPGLPAKSPL